MHALKLLISWRCVFTSKFFHSFNDKNVSQLIYWYKKFCLGSNIPCLRFKSDLEKNTLINSVVNKSSFYVIIFIPHNNIIVISLTLVCKIILIERLIIKLVWWKTQYLINILNYLLSPFLENEI